MGRRLVIVDFVGPAEIRRARKERRKPGVAVRDLRPGMCRQPIAIAGGKPRACGRVTPGPVKLCLPHELVRASRPISIYQKRKP